MVPGAESGGSPCDFGVVTPRVMLNSQPIELWLACSKNVFDVGHGNRLRFARWATIIGSIGRGLPILVIESAYSSFFLRQPGTQRVNFRDQRVNFALPTRVRCGNGWNKKYFLLSKLSTPSDTPQFLVNL